MYIYILKFVVLSIYEQINYVYIIINVCFYVQWCTNIFYMFYIINDLILFNLTVL